MTQTLHPPSGALAHGAHPYEFGRGIDHQRVMYHGSYDEDSNCALAVHRRLYC